jgi:hypothetical protein
MYRSNTRRNSNFFHMCFWWFLQQTGYLFLHSINRSVFLKKTHSCLFVAWTKFTCTMFIHFSIKRSKLTFKRRKSGQCLENFRPVHFVFLPCTNTQHCLSLHLLFLLIIYFTYYLKGRYMELTIMLCVQDSFLQ